MDPKDVTTAIDKVSVLPLRKRVRCILLAAEKVQHLWSEHCSEFGIPDYSIQLLGLLKEWTSENDRFEDLMRISDLLHDTLPKNLAKEDDPTPGYSGWSLHAVAMVALGRCGDVEPDIVSDAVLYAAGAAEKIGSRPYGTMSSMLSNQELLFIERWYSECLEAVIMQS